MLACGGTRLELGADGAIAAETVWNDDPTSSATGGGDQHRVPASGLAVRRPASRTAAAAFPDVSAVADPQTGYQVLVDGSPLVIGGTSAVAPLWAALVARLVQATGAALPELRRRRSTRAPPPVRCRPGSAT